MAKAGRPRKVIDWAVVEKLCTMQATQQEICDWFAVNDVTLYRACKRELKTDFATYFAQKRVGGKASLRRRQWLKAVDDGDTTMLIFLGKQYLGQADKLTHEGGDPEKPVTIRVIRQNDDRYNRPDTDGAASGPAASSD